MRRLTLLLVVGMLSTVSAAAIAHALLDSAAPPVGGAVPVAPREIRLTFTEGIEPRFSGVELATAAGQPIPTGPASRNPADDKQLVLPLPPLAPGPYRVSWHVVSVDTHRTEGAYIFTVGQ